MTKNYSKRAWLADSTRFTTVLMVSTVLIAATGTFTVFSRFRPSQPMATHVLSRVSDRAVDPVLDAPSAPVADPTAGAPQAATATPVTEPVAPSPVEPISSTVAAASKLAGTTVLGKGAIPVGKGMWLYLPERVEGGDIDALVAKATAVGLTHIYVRTGSSRTGFYAAAYLDQLLGKAHAAGIRVFGWDFPYLEDIGADVNRAIAAMSYITPDGHRIDGFAPDIETPSEGTNLNAETAGSYSQQLRSAVGAGYPLIAVVPRPSSYMQVVFPYQAIVPHYDAVAPMVYWLNRQPDTDAGPAVAYFRDNFGKPVIPVGQAYDGGPEGGRPGPPPPDEINRFLVASEQAGAVGASFWSWQHADQLIWDTIQAAPEFRWDPKPVAEMRPSDIRSLQALLAQFGYSLTPSGTWDEATTIAVSAFQQVHSITPTGTLDPATIAALLMPVAPPIS